MKVPHVIAEIVSEFSGFNHTPDFKASRSTGNFEETEEGGATSSTPIQDSHHQHHEHHGHSLYFGKHLPKKEKPSNADPDADSHSNHSGHSGHKHHKLGLSVHFEKFFHIGHHSDREDHHHSKTNSGASTPARKNSGTMQPHKHSIHLMVGADEVPTVCATPPNEAVHGHYVKNPNSSPSISRVASFSSLKEKLNKIKRTNSSDSETDFPEKKCSVSSYRVVSH